MDRQDLDRRGMLGSLMGGATLLGLGNAGCSKQERALVPEVDANIAARLDPAKANDILVSLDKRMAWIDKQVPPDDVLPLSKLLKAKTFDTEEIEQTSKLLKTSIRSLYLTGRFLDMPDEYKAHPGVQSRIISAQSDMDVAVMGMTEMLEKATPEDFQRVQDQLRKDPLLGERIAQWIEQPTIDDGMPIARRYSTRASILQLADRMRAQSPSFVTDPVVSKVRRIEALPHSEAEQIRRISARVGEEAFWKHQQHLAALHSGWLAQVQTGQGANSNAYPPAGTVVKSPDAEKPGDWAISKGGVIMGFGGGSVLLGLAFAGLEMLTSAGVFAVPALILGVTVGPILLIVGLIFLLVGLSQRAAS